MFSIIAKRCQKNAWDNCMMLRSMHMYRWKIHNFFQKKQSIFFCTVPECRDYRSICAIAMTGITDKVTIFTDRIG